MRGGGLDINTPSIPTTVSALHIHTPALSTANKPLQANVSLGAISSGAGIFSPLDAGSYRRDNFASPLLQESPQLGVTLPAANHVTSASTTANNPMSHVSHVTNVSTALPEPQRWHDVTEDTRASQEGEDSVT